MFEESPKSRRNLLRGKKKVLILSAGILVVLVAVLIVGWYLLRPSSDTSVAEAKKQASSTAYKEATDAIEVSGTTDADLAKLVAEYGPQYDKSLEAVQKSETAKWDSETVNKAHLCLLYADKIGAYSQVETMYFLIEAAKFEGVDVDANSAGLDSTEREAIWKKIPSPTGPASTTEITENAL